MKLNCVSLNVCVSEGEASERKIRAIRLLPSHVNNKMERIEVTDYITQTCRVRED